MKAAEAEATGQKVEEAEAKDEGAEVKKEEEDTGGWHGNEGRTAEGEYRKIPPCLLGARVTLSPRSRLCFPSKARRSLQGHRYVKLTGGPPHPSPPPVRPAFERNWARMKGGLGSHLGSQRPVRTHGVPLAGSLHRFYPLCLQSPASSPCPSPSPSLSSASSSSTSCCCCHSRLRPLLLLLFSLAPLISCLVPSSSFALFNFTLFLLPLSLSLSLSPSLPPASLHLSPSLPPRSPLTMS